MFNMLFQEPWLKTVVCVNIANDAMKNKKMGLLTVIKFQRKVVININKLRLDHINL